MLKNFIILTYLAFSSGSTELEQFPSFDLITNSAEQNLQPDPTSTTTADLSETYLENSFPTFDTVVEMFPPNDPTVKNAPSSDTIIENSFPANDTPVEFFPPSDPTIKNPYSSDTVVENPFPTNDTVFEMFPPSDPTVKNPPSSAFIENSFPTNNTEVDFFPPSEPTVRNAPSSDTIVEYSFPSNDTAVEIFPPSDPTIKNVPSRDTTIEYPYPPSDTAVENSIATYLTLKNYPSIDKILKNFPRESDIPLENSSPTPETIVEYSTSETPDAVDNIEWRNGAADLKSLVNNYPCSGQDCPNIDKTTTKPFDLEFILTRVPRAHTHAQHDDQKSNCPVEPAAHIGSFVVPSQQDIIKNMRRLLHNTFANYRMKTISFLEDIDKASKSMAEYENSCFNKSEYHECVVRVSTGTKMITSSVLNSMDNTMQDVEFLYQSQKCNLSDSASIDDPMKLIKLIASEASTIDFAMPGFLRLLYTCFRFCASHSEDVTSFDTYNPKSLEKVIRPQHLAHRPHMSNLKDPRQLRFSSRPRYKKLGRMISLKGKPAGGLKYLNSDRISYIKKPLS